MKVTCTKSELSKGVQTVQTAITGKGGLPILSNILLEADSTSQNKLKLVSTDLEVGIKCIIAADVARKGAVTVPAKKFGDIVRELPDKEIQIEVSKENKIIITCDKIVFRVVGLPKDEFPILPEFKHENIFSVKQGVLKDIIRKTIFAISTDETRYVLNGLYLQTTNNKIEVVSTDGRRLSYIVAGPLPKSGKKLNVIIPAKAINELNRILGREGDVKISFSENQISFELDNILLVSRLIEGRFPNYEQVIPKGCPIKLQLKTQELLDAVKRISLLAPEKAESIKITISNDKMMISAISQGVGEAEEEVGVSYKGDSFELAYNPRYIGDVLKNIDTEMVKLEFTDSASPAIIRPEVKAAAKDKDKESYLCVIMPMRL
ncbi:MAG: DNA polymerase III subunit beta [bacterium]